jgi:acetyltransferase-like isoleucine patch superfamily enzyme
MINLLKKTLFYFRLIAAGEYNKASLYTKYLGIKFGKNTRILHFPRFGSEPFLIEFGDNVTITRGVSFVTHDGGVALFRDEYPGLNVFGKISVGNNVFIGINTTILPGISIGNNVVIGANSLINKDIPSNCVVAGIPAKFIKSIQEYKADSLSKGIQINTKNRYLRKKEIIEKFEKKNSDILTNS